MSTLTRRIQAILTADASQFDRAMKEATGAVKTLGSESEKIGGKPATGLRALSNNIRDNSQAWDEVSNKSMIAGGAIAAGLGLATKAAISWESAFAGVKKTVDDTEAGYAALEQELRDLAEVLPATHQEIAAVAEAAGQLGVQRENVVEFTRVMIDLGESTNLSAEEAATGLARFANVMGTNLADVDRLGSAIVGLGNNFATTESEILEMATRLSGVGRQAGLTEGEVLGLAAAARSVGIEAEAGGTAFSRVITEMGIAVDTNGDKLEGFARTAGMTAEEFQNLWESNSGEAFTRFVQGLGEVQARGESLEPILDELGMTDIRVGDAFRKAAAASDLFTRALAQGNEEYEQNNALTEEAAKRYETAASQLSMARNQITNAAIDAGAVLAPVLVELAGMIAGLASSFADLPKPIQEGAVWLAALGSAGLLAFGGTVKAVRAAQDLQDAMTKIGMSGPTATGAVKGLGKAAGIAAIGFAAVQLDQWDRDAQAAAVDTEELTRELATLGDEADRVGPALTGMFQRTRGSLGPWAIWREEIVTTDEALSRFADKARREYMDANFWDKLWGNVGAGSTDLPVIIGGIDQALADLVNSGRAAEAEATFRSFMDSLDPELVEQVAADFGLYSGALEGVTGAASGTIEAQDLLEGGILEIANASAEATAATEDAIEAFQKWKDEIAASDRAFIDILGAYDAIIAKNTEVAQASADATESSKDSWEDFYDGQSVSIDEYIAELERQVEAQLAWETNMLELAARVPQAVIDELAALGPAGAALVADLADGTEEQLDRIVAAMGNAGVEGPKEFAQNLRLGAQILPVIMAEAGAEAADAAAAELASGEKTIQQVIDQYDLDFIVDADTGEAVRSINKLYTDYNNGRLTIRVVSDTTSFVVPRGMRVVNADGGLHVKTQAGLARAFADGGMYGGTIGQARPQIRPYGGPRGILWGEEGSGPWEAFISGHPRKRSRSRHIADEVVARLGGRIEWVAAYANGGIRETSSVNHYYAPTTSGGARDVQVNIPVQTYVEADPVAIGASVAWQVGGLP